MESVPYMELPTDISQYKQVLQLATRPSDEEFSQTAQVAAIGITLIGFIGFVIFAIMTFLPA